MNPAEGEERVRISDERIHPHLQARMTQRGITREELDRTLNEGREALDAKPSTKGKVLVLPYRAEWEGKFFEEKEVTVYYKEIQGTILLLTAKARYGEDFRKE